MFEQTIQQQQGPGNRWWPKIHDYSSASDAMRNGAVMYGIVSGMTLVVTVIALLSNHSLLGLNAWSLLDVAAFAVIAWRVLRHSYRWAIAGLVLYLVEKLMMVMGPTKRSPGVLSIVFLLYFYHAVRGGLYIRKHGVPRDGDHTLLDNTSSVAAGE